MKQTYYSILFFVLVPFFLAAQPTLEIWEIQGDGEASPYENEIVISENNVVTAVGDDFFYMQTPTNRSDGNENTSDGILVYYNSTSLLEVGDVVSVEGYVEESFDLTIFDSDWITVTIESHNANLPEPVLLNENFPSESAFIMRDLEKVEGMYVEISPAVTTAATNEYDETMIKAGSTRSFREPGIEYPAPTGLPEWDGNPEIFEFDPDGLGLDDQEELAAGMVIYAKGVIHYAYGEYQLLPTEYEIFGSPALRSVDEPMATEATVGSLNCYVFSNTSSGYADRLTKFAKYIVNLMKSPDILAVQEVRSLEVLQNLADKIKFLYPDLTYTPYLVSSGQNGGFVIEVGYLVKNTVTDVTITQLGANEIFSQGGKLHYRPPLLLEGNFNTTSTIPIKVLNLHLKSLGGVTTSTEVRQRRHEQAISVANMVQDMADDNLIVLGDLNAYQFSDGYVDVVNQIAGTSSLGASFPVLNIVNSPLIHQMSTLPFEEQYSYVYQGNAQLLDHCLTTELTDMTATKVQFVRANADNHENLADDDSNPWRVSDHDGFVLYLELGSPVSTDNPFEDFSFQVKYENPFQGTSPIILELEEDNEIRLELIQSNGQVVFQKDLGQLPTGQHHLNLPSTFPGGIYFLKINGRRKSFVGKMILR